MALMLSFSGSPEIGFFDDFNLEGVLESVRITNFKITIFLIWLGKLMTSTQPNHPHQNKKKWPTITNHTRSVAKTLLTIVYIILTQVSVPIENGSNSHQPSHIPLRDQHSRAHSCPYRTSTFVPTQGLQATHKLSWFLTRIESRCAHGCEEQWQHEGHEGFR
jgi:hypothetical protein